MLNKARDKIRPGMRLHLIRCEQPFLSIPFRDESFDAVVSTYAFHHVLRREKEAGLREMVRVLKPGGSIAIGDLMFENADAEQSAMAEYDWLDDEPYSHLDKLESCFKRMGMDMKSEQYTPVTWVVRTRRPTMTRDHV
jgi:putative AdoMet-dependent methyltransferase